MSKPSVLEQKIAEVKAKRDAAAMQVAMYDQVLELLVTPVQGETEKVATKPRAARGSVAAAVLEALKIGSRNIDELEAITSAPRSSIRKALTGLLRDGKVSEGSNGQWSLRNTEPVLPPVVHLHKPEQYDAATGEVFEDASVRED